MRVRFHDAAIHEGTGVTLIAITDDIFGIVLVPGCFFPLEARGKSGATATANAGGFDLFDNSFRSHCGQCRMESAVALVSDIFLDTLRIDMSPVSQDNKVLLSEEINVFDVRYFFFRLRHVEKRGRWMFCRMNQIVHDLCEVVGVQNLINFSSREKHHGGTLAAGDKTLRLDQ